MSVAELDANQDWTYGRGKNGYITGVKEVEQNVITRILEFVDDWFLDVTAGINWIGLLGAKNTQEALEASIKRRILETAGVAAITSFNVINDVTTRRLQVDYTITTIYNVDINNSLGVSV